MTTFDLTTVDEFAFRFSNDDHVIAFVKKRFDRLGFKEDGKDTPFTSFLLQEKFSSKFPVYFDQEARRRLIPILYNEQKNDRYPLEMYLKENQIRSTLDDLFAVEDDDQAVINIR